MKLHRVAWVLAVSAAACGSSGDAAGTGGEQAVVEAPGSGGAASGNAFAMAPAGSGGATSIPIGNPIGNTPAANPSAMPPTHSSGPSGGAVAGSGAAASGSGGASSGSGGSAAPEVDPPGTVTLTMDKFMLAAGQEIYKCQNFDNPFGGQDTAVGRIVTDMAPGSHHLHVYHMTTSATRTLEDCTISDFHPLMHAASSPHAETTYPAGMAVKLRGANGLRIQVHYLNTIDQMLEVNAVLKLTPVDSGAITKWISELYFNRTGLSVPPGSGQSVTTNCAVPATYGQIGLISGGSHMHMRGVHFTAQTSTGMQLIDTNQWDEPPPTFYDPPVMLNPGDSISWTCTWNNDTGAPLVFGESAQKNEMCIYLARFFSDPDGTQLECQAQGATGMVFERTY